ncbi:ATP-grasp domain-containing protein [Methylococcus capsulatus]|uniref:ATP-grasp domain-containing protein n=1 Tax=Methylococcus capsulatus TaxID=414 RepID=UPI002FD98734
MEFDILLVVGIDAVGIARFPRILHDAGCRVTLLAPPGLAVARSRYVSRHVATAAGPEALPRQLQTLLAERHFHHVIVGDEPTLTVIARHRGEAWLDGWFPVDHRSDAVEVILSKSAFQRAADAAGLTTPKSEVRTGLAGLEAAARAMGYPVMLKKSHGCSGSGVRKVAGEAELGAAFELLNEGNGTLLIQQFLDGRVGSSDVLFDRGVPVCWQSWYSRQCWPTPLASSCVREAMVHREIGPMLAGVGALSGFHGFAGVDWVHDTERDRIYLIEFNPRPTPTYHLDVLSGVRFADSFHAILAGTRSAGCREPSAAACGRVVYLFPQSLYRAIAECDLDSLWRCWSDAPWSDPVLMAAHLRRVLTHFLPVRWRQAVKRLLGR